MLLLVGLGNPGQKYEHNRHNIGYVAVDEIVHRHSFGPWKSRFQGVVSEGRLGSQKVLALKPATFMNLSGQSVGEAMRFFKLGLEDVVVLHDELALEPGKMRVKTGGGSAGNNGIKSITQHIGAEYRRVRIGIGHPGDRDKVSSYVLHDFAKADRSWIDDLVPAISDAAPKLADGDDAGFMNDVARMLKPNNHTSAPNGAPS
ncbi:MAG: aminoacyl-tRNA hydrolase [Alphaproteobacteria bacterium]|jgi:peptidyl-tRNA hydrolase, PTH1 family|nr:aminoacyl-tRNA hydrolase [Alphaproteobacteria bacterium]MBT4083218.1 aminoacyl-tRNA hydrolase [Alphaproteobacteria bacterium]MBT4544286.1 aminoacyl-tRNA hydrolase [Alphaproteobacteria bacterium]MBT7747801.1 aminoacyl-tRNA hydrolase [Alphaproteobacteria bacterium]